VPLETLVQLVLQVLLVRQEPLERRVQQDRLERREILALKAYKVFRDRQVRREILALRVQQDRLEQLDQQEHKVILDQQVQQVQPVIPEQQVLLVVAA
jgi:hypothetical protein